MSAAAMWLATLLLSAAPAAQAGGEAADETPARLEAVLGLDDLTESLWPDWAVSRTPLALCGLDGSCLLFRCPDPPSGSERVRPSARSRTTFYRADAAALSIDSEGSTVNGVPTGLIDRERFAHEPVPATIEASLRAFLGERCPEVTEPVDVVDGYPMTAENLALCDIECELLAAALAAPDDSLAARTREFMAVRTFRRITMRSPLADSYERRVEFAEGVPAYVAARCGGDPGRAEGSWSGLRAGDLPAARLDTLLTERSDPSWYLHDRPRATGAGVAALLDRFRPGWHDEFSGPCAEPYDVLYELTRTELPRALGILARHGYGERREAKQALIEEAKSDEERLFESIVESGGPTITVQTKLLASSSVSYDPENVVRLDEHRSVHMRILRVEFSGGTRVHIIGRPIAVFVGDDEFAVERIVIRAPEELQVTVGGEPVSLEPGLRPFDEPLSVVAPGLLIEARVGVIIVGEAGVTFVLHR
jgi:hypothetical protein